MPDHEDEHDHEHEHEHDHDQEVEEAIEEALELDTQTQVFLEMRRQNIELLKIAVELAGYSGVHPPLKPDHVEGAVRSVWDVYSEFYSWVDPEETEDDDEDEDDL
jgi:hypothetical protein